MREDPAEGISEEMPGDVQKNLRMICQKICETEDPPDRSSKGMAEDLPARRYARKNAKRNVKKTAGRLSQKNQKDMAEGKPERMRERMSGEMSKRKSERLKARRLHCSLGDPCPTMGRI